MAFQIRVNGKSNTVDVPADTPLLWVLRDVLKLTGTSDAAPATASKPAGDAEQSATPAT